jgi:hypothetical protein
VADAFMAPVDRDPESARFPDHPPEAVHEAALVADQFSVELEPLATVLGLADKLTVGAGAGEVTETLADWVAPPPAPEQVRAKVVLALSAPLDCEPLTDLLPDHPFDAEHAVALRDDQVSVTLLPLVTVLGLAEMETVGTG